MSFTADDSNRAKQYADNLVRATAQSSAGDLDTFSTGLGMSAVYGVVQDVDIARVAQLINKTNQFNPTTHRYSQDEVTELCKDAANLALQFRLIDRFGDNGLVSAMILRPDSGEPGLFEIDTWVMSCRVFGRELEFEAMNIAVEMARARGVRTLRGRYLPTAKNVVVRDLYDRLGFARVSPADAEVSLWALPIESYLARATHITRIAQS